MGIVFLAVCHIQSTFQSGTALASGDLGYLLSNGLEIAGWVSLWHPIEMFLDEW
jgi:hypothetical protein